jgi:hypothetical protein
LRDEGGFTALKLRLATIWPLFMPSGLLSAMTWS